MKKSFRYWATIILGICLALGIVVYGAGRYSFGVFMTPLADSMGWSRSEISLAVSMNLVLYGLFSPLVGWMFSVLGARKVMISGALLMSGALLCMYFVSHLWMFYFLYGVLAAFGANAVGRIGQATLVTYWFERTRGLMLGITSVSIGIGAAVMAPLVRMFLDVFGWRLAFVAIGFLLIVFVLIPIVLFVKGRGRPEDRGFGPDGVLLEESQSDAAPPADSVKEEGDSTVTETLGNKMFWVITLSMAISFMADYLVLFHGPASFEDRGLSGPAAAFVLSIGTFFSCVGRVGIGWLSDVVSVKAAFIFCFAIQVIAAPFILFGTSDYTLWIFSFLWGLGYGGGAVIGAYAFAELFGRKNFSTIYGIGTMVMVFFGAGGSMLGGLLYDAFGNYDIAWYVCTSLWFSSLVIVTLGMNFRMELGTNSSPAEG